MTDDVTRRPWWRWMAGMEDEYGCRVVCVVDGHAWAIDQEGERCRLGPAASPDPTDPATLGCLLALARELTGDPQAHLRATHGQEGVLWWTLASGMTRHLGPSRPTEWSALVAACDAAWGTR